jgi:hypothetical protein
MHRLWFFMALLAPFNPGCLCNGNGHVEQKPFATHVGDNVVNCACNLSFRHEICTEDCAAHFNVQLCVPPWMRDPPQVPPNDMGMSAESVYASRLDGYCKDQVTSIVYNLIQVWNGAWCDYKAPFAPNGGVGDSVHCFAQEIEDNGLVASGTAPSCEKMCPTVACDYGTNCREVQDEWGTPHLDRCKCSQVISNQCMNEPPGGTPTPVFCRPTEPVK